MDFLELIYFGIFRRRFAAMTEKERAQHFRREMILSVVVFAIGTVVIVVGLMVYLRRANP